MEWGRRSAAVAGVLMVAVLAAGIAFAGEQPDATFRFTGWSVSAGVGYLWGDGVLTYQGKEYPFSVGSLAMPVVGASRVSALGHVYHLKSLDDFDGTFVAATAEATVGGGAGVTAMWNPRGVVINLLSTTQGLELKLATSGIRVTLDK